jgi:hypothetical protein
MNSTKYINTQSNTSRRKYMESKKAVPYGLNSSSDVVSSAFVESLNLGHPEILAGK